MGNQQGKERRDYGRKIDWTTAEPPSAPGKPYLVPQSEDKVSDIIVIRWSPPTYDGGAPVIGYIVEHRRTGSPHWLRATPHLVRKAELPLTGLEPGWRYQFRVSAENDVGKSEPGDLSEPLTVTPQKWAASAPIFNIELQDQVGLENEKVEFRVHVLGVPPPTVSWYKDGFEVFSSRRTKIVTENDSSTFIIHQAALEDEGEIKCTATNRAGHAVTKAILKLEAPPRIRLPRKYEDGLIFEKGEMIRLKVTVAGRPRPELFWYHNGELLQKSERVEVSNAGMGSMVKIMNACRDDRGEYVLRGENKIGEDIASFLVTVTDRPSPPGNIKIVTIGRTVTLTWSDPEDDGGCKIGTYIVEYFRIGWDMWLKAKNSRQLSTILEDLIEGSEYKFRIRAENPYGISDPSEESEVIFISDPKRGILKPTPRKEILDILKPELNKPDLEAQNKQKLKETEESEKRRMLEEKAKKLLDTPLSELLPYESSKTEKRKADSSVQSLSLSKGNENDPPVVPKRRNKGRTKLTPSPVGSESMERQKGTPSPSNSESTEKRQLTPSPVQKRQKLVRSPLSERKNLTPSPSDLQESRSKLTLTLWEEKKEEDSNLEGESSKRNSRFSFGEREPANLDSPLYPRENDDTIMHGSSELMLVLYPRERSKSVEISAQERSEIEMNLMNEGVAPPISLSAPELGGSYNFEIPPIRNAVSSTELLHERCVARLYQDALDEEAQEKVKRRYSMDRKSVERRSSLKEPLIDRRHSFKENEKEQEIVENEICKQEPENLETENDKLKKTNDQYQSFIPRPKGHMNRLSSVEREHLEFALVRERLKKKEEEKRLKASEGISEMTPTSSSVDTEDFEDEDEDDESLEDEGEDEYLDQDNSKEDVDDEDYDMTDIINLKDSKIPLPKATPLKPRRIAPFAEQEDDTYHPRSMIPTKSVLTRIENPAEEKPKKDPVPEVVAPTAVQPTKKEDSLKTSKIPVPASTKSKKASKILKKFGLKKDKKVPEVLLTPAEPPSPPPPKPILKNKPQPKKKMSPMSTLKFGLNRNREKSVSEEESENELAGRKKKVRITEPEEEKKQEEEEKPIDINAVENQVLIFHYSDIVKEFGGNKRPPQRLYLNYEELKAHASPEKKPQETILKKKEEPRPLPSKPEIKTNNTKTVEKSQIDEKAEEAVDRKTSEVKPEAAVQGKGQPSELSDSRFRNTLDFATDVAMFLVACWLYLFKNELYAIPILCIMAYRQLKDMASEKYKNFKKFAFPEPPSNEK